MKNNKYYFNFEDLQFHIGSSDGVLPSNSFQKMLLSNDEILKSIVKGKKFLDGN